MYLSSRRAPPDVTADAAESDMPAAGRRVSKNVVFIGLTSMFTDLSSEMVTAILPLYLTAQLGLTPFEFGAFDGTYQAAAAILGLTGGLAADRWRRHKEVATAGYGLSAGCRAGLLASAGAWGPTMAFLYIDRVGKGIRTAPRDALISLSAAPSRMAEAFGLHRALDTLGALLGPLVALLLLQLVPGGYDTVFVTSFCAAIIGLGMLTLLVDNPPLAIPVSRPARSKASPGSAMVLLRSKRYRSLLVAGTAVSALTLSDAFLFLTFQRRSSLTSSLFPLLYVGSATMYLVLAVPLGRLADRVGRAPVFLVGHLLMVGAYGVVLFSAGHHTVRLLVLVGLVGAYYAATAGVLIAMVAVVVPPEVRTFAIALLATCIAGGRLFSSLVFGSLWSRWDSHVAVTVFVVGLSVSVALATAVLRSGRLEARA